MSKVETASTADEAEESNEDEVRDDPEIEEDLVKEELRIDGICGVY